MEEKLVSHLEILQLCMSKLIDAGIPEEHARTTASVLVHANLRGVDSHGVMRMEHYIQKISQGGIRANPMIATKPTGAVTAIVDGDDGLGHVIVDQAMKTAIDIANNQGVGMVSAINSSHCGALSYFVKMAADNGMIGIAMTNTDKMVVPFGGSSAYFGTNPMAFGFPAGANPPIILDMATSAVAYGKILGALQAGTQIPPDWGVDQHGQPVTDPRDFAALLPFGGAKGYALGMVVDIFSGILTGSPYGPHIAKMHGGDLGEKRKLGHFVCAIDIARFTSGRSFRSNIDQMIGEIHAIPPAAGFRQVMIPGEPEHLKEEHRREHGIPLPIEIYNFLSQK
ncbi:MAG: ureidoglycolate dehydrogenase [Paenibacillaceae bacterium]|nr:ureidoglycolate dehydrogenase [Paenibacillaceae bacterium]